MYYYYFVVVFYVFSDKVFLIIYETDIRLLFLELLYLKVQTCEKSWTIHMIVTRVDLLSTIFFLYSLSCITRSFLVDQTQYLLHFHHYHFLFTTPFPMHSFHNISATIFQYTTFHITVTFKQSP